MQNLTKTITLAGILAVSAATIHAQGIGFFSRAGDLGNGHVWVVNEFSEGPNILDMHVRRYSDSGWTRCREGNSCPTNEAHLTFGAPIYAPVDGVVRTCWRNFDDNPSPGVVDPRVVSEGNPNPKIFRGGNHVNIETPDGKVVLIAHLKKGSVPESLCPFNAQEADAAARSGSYPAQAIIPAADRAAFPVRRGQFIGYAGNSGTSSNPHVHIHRKTNTGDNTEGAEGGLTIPFEQVWVQNYHQASAAQSPFWYKLAGDSLTSVNGNTMVHPSPFLRRTSETAGAVSSTDVAVLSTGRVVTAVRNGLGDLMLIAWATPFDNTLHRQGDVVEGSATNVKVVAVGSNHVVAGVKDSGGRLKLILYQVSNTGTFQRLDDVVSDSVHSFDMTVTNGNTKKIVVAARREPDDKLKVLVWNVNLGTGTNRFEAAGSRLEGVVSAVAVTGTRNFLGAAVAVRTAEQTLKVIPYRLSADNTNIVRGADHEAGEVGTAIDITAIPRGVVAAMRDSAGQLRVISLQTSPNGNISGNKEALAWSAGQISEVRITTTPTSAGGNVVTAVRDSAGELRLMSWIMGDDASGIRRSGSVRAGEASKISIGGGSLYTYPGTPSRDVLHTAMRDSDGNFRLIQWEVNLNP